MRSKPTQNNCNSHHNNISNNSGNNCSITNSQQEQQKRQQHPRGSGGHRYHKMKNLFSFNKTRSKGEAVVVADNDDGETDQPGGTYNGSTSCASSHGEARPLSPSHRHQRQNRTAAGTRRGLHRKPPTTAQHSRQQQQHQHQHQQQQQHQQTQNANTTAAPGSNMFSANGRNGYQFTDVYRKTADVQLDKGNFGYIYTCENLLVPAGSPYQLGAVKVCQPNDLDKMAGPIVTYDDVETNCQEIRNLVLLNHQQPPCPYILHLFEYFYNPRTMELHLVTELLQMNLRDWVERQPRFTEDEGREVARVVLRAIQYMHDHNVMHRDIKEANVVFRYVTQSLLNIIIWGVFLSADDF